MSHTAIILLALAFLIGWMGGKQAGLSCDWSHVSVVGKEPAR